MSYQKVHFRRHGFNWLPMLVLGLFLLMGGWKLVFLIPPILLLLAAFWIFSPMARRWKSEYRRGELGNWGDWSERGFDSFKRKNNWNESDETEADGGRVYEAKRKNDDDVYYV